ncbi:hypothetical protein SDC9_123004 [bioreactor metagenome]|uniref:N-acetyltransferase domain-containing protein n=1 Tax=bioreactor metagenome TaxID=1076179 RepID=A0A645CGB2_9ZZZZ
MRKCAAFLPTLDFVAVSDGKIVGNIVYTTAKLVADKGTTHTVLSFGPLSVLPDYQGRGIGKMLIEHTKKIATDLGYDAILIYGDPVYYKRFGFVAAEQFGIRTADNMYADALQVCVLKNNVLSGLAGRFVEDEIYNMDSSAAEQFDKTFVPKEKLSDTPSQKHFLEMIQLRRKAEI